MLHSLKKDVINKITIGNKVIFYIFFSFCQPPEAETLSGVSWESAGKPWKIKALGRMGQNEKNLEMKGRMWYNVFVEQTKQN
ncbi:MAG: hypothetical protein ACLVF9_07310 [Enterocloster sp.]